MHPSVHAPMRGLLAACCAALLAACGGGGEGAPIPPAGTVGKLVPAVAPSLLAHYRDRLRAARDAAGGEAVVALRPPAGPAPVAAPSTGDATAATAATAAVDASGPVVQEPGVDEPDVARVSGDVVWALTPPAEGGQRLRAWRVRDGGARLEPAGSLALDAGLRFDGLFVDATRGRVIVVANGDAGYGPMPLTMPVGVAVSSMPAYAPRDAALAVVDARDAAAPSLERTLRLGGALLAARIADDRLWTVVRSRPALDGFDWSWRDAAANERWLAGLRAEALLPALRVDDAPVRPLVSPAACHLQPDAPGGTGEVTTIAAFELADPAAAPLARCVAAPVEAVLVTRDAMVVSTTRRPAAGPSTAPTAAEAVTDVHRFALSAASIAYRGSASVPGRLGRGADTARFMMSVDGPRLRVVTQRDVPGPGSPARLTILEDAGAGELRTLSVLPNERRPQPIGKPGEQVHGVRFVGGRAYVVTFRRIDPVYVLDLADPADPRVLGELEVPGFSDRLYPLADGLLLGVGHDAATWGQADVTTGVLVSLIDARDPARPIERARRVIGGPGSTSASDRSPLGTTIRAVDGRLRVALPVAVHDEVPPPWTASMPSSLRWRGFTRLAAQRFVVDPVAATLSDAPPVAAPDAAADGAPPARTRAWAAGPYDRAIDVGDHTWLWYDGRFVGARW